MSSRPLLPLAAVLVTTLGTASTSHAQPVLSALSETSLDRSGLLFLTGSGFGAPGAGSTVTIDGIPAIATTWKTSEIHAYVPEGAALGAVPVQVVTPAGASNTLPLTVTPRQADGRTLWRFEFDSPFAGVTVTASDDRVLVADNLRMYALTPDGGLLWVRAGAGGTVAIDVAPDGTIYSSGGGVVALNPDGSVKWTFTLPTAGILTNGPNLGPDGNVYAAQETFGGGLGAFSLDPTGQLRWSNPGSPAVFDTGGSGPSAVAFFPLSADRLVFGHAGSNPGAPPAIWGFDLQGAQQFYLADGCNSSPVVDPFARFVTGGSGTCGIIWRDLNANVVQTASPPQAMAINALALGPGGDVYIGSFFSGRLWAVRPDGTTKWFVDGNTLVSHVGASPDGAWLVEDGQASFGTSGWVRGFSALDGSLKFTEPLLPEQGIDQHVVTIEPGFAPDSSAAYVTTRFVGSGTGTSYFQAVGLCDTAAEEAAYGAGWPGTTGVPALSVAQPPLVGGALELTIGNSAGTATQGVLIVGAAPASIPSALGGTLLVQPSITTALPLPAAGLVLEQTLPVGAAICGATGYLQLLVADPGASHGVAFSRGLRLTVGAP